MHHCYYTLIIYTLQLYTIVYDWAEKMAKYVSMDEGGQTVDVIIGTHVVFEEQKRKLYSMVWYVQDDVNKKLKRNGE